MSKIIIQIDRTIMDADGQPNARLAAEARELHKSGRVIFFTMITESQRATLYDWILKHLGRMFENVPLYMPADNDTRDEKDIVADWLRDIKQSRETVNVVIEGRKDSVQMWADFGASCLELHGSK